MYTPQELERFGMLLDPQMHELEDRIMSDIIRRIRINGEITSTADWQIHRLYELGMSKREIKKILKETLDLSPAEISHMYKQVLRSGYARSRELYKAKGAPWIPFDQNEGLQQLISAIAVQTSETLQNITQSLGFATRVNGKLAYLSIADYYQKTLDAAMLDIASGAFDYNTVLKRTVREMTNSGLRSIDYASGWANRVDVAARRAIMTDMGQLTGKINEDNAKALETDWFEITWHSGYRPEHWWGGKWYKRDDLAKICGLGTVTGLCGANCYHDYYPVIPGISEPTYTDEQLAEMSAKEQQPVEYNGKTYTGYEATQRQRHLETTMRAQRQEMKLLKEGGADEDDLINLRARYRATSQEYVRFSEAASLPQQRERVSIDGLGNIMQGKYTGGSDKPSPVKVPPVGAKRGTPVPDAERTELLEHPRMTLKSLTNDGNGGIIQTEESELGTFKKSILPDKRMSDEYYTAVKDKFSHGSDTAKSVFNKFVHGDSVAEADFHGTPHYDPDDGKIHMDYLTDLQNPRGTCVTWFHEHGHYIDAAAGKISDDPVFRKALDDDWLAYVKEYGKSHKLGTFPKVYLAIDDDLQTMREHSAVSDLINAITKNGIRGVAGHRPEYWSDDSVICSEAFAHMFEAQFDAVRYDEMKKYFPNALQYFEGMLGGLLK